eukprot:8893683-Pyramimonas_sp.AAC.1
MQKCGSVELTAIDCAPWPLALDGSRNPGSGMRHDELSENPPTLSARGRNFSVCSLVGEIEQR